MTGQLRRDHPAPYPLEIPRRLIRMFSFVGDTVVDPFAGTGTTAMAALETGRNSISVEVEPRYVKLIEERFRSSTLKGELEVRRLSTEGVATASTVADTTSNAEPGYADCDV